MSFGRLERTTGAQPMSDINMTPLVDVMLVLVVIFILTAPLLASSIRLDLPQAEGTGPAAAPEFVTVVVDATGQAYLDDQPLSQAALAVRLQRIGAAQPDTEVNCAPTPPCPMAAWSKSWAPHMKRGCSASASWPSLLRPVPRNGWLICY